MKERIFRFKKFQVKNELSAMKVGTDGVLLGAWANVDGAGRILDVGTGCGVIALMMAQRNPQAVIDAIDIDGGAVEESAENFRNSEWGSRLSAKLIDYKDFTPTHKYDLVISNPPYFSNGVLPKGAERTIARHDNMLSISDLLFKSVQILTASGILSIITPVESENEVMEQASECSLYPVRISRVSGTVNGEPKRILWEFSKLQPERIIETSFAIEFSPLNYTPQYIELTKDFYLKM